MKKWILSIFMAALAFLNVLQPAMAGEPTWPELSLNKAIEMAITQNKALKKAELEIKRTEALRDEASDQLDFTPTGGSGYDPQVEAAWYSLLQADLTWRMSKKSYDARLDGIALAVCQLYWNVLKAQENVKVKELALELARLELQKSQSAYRLGLTGKSQSSSVGGTVAAIKGLEQAGADVAKAESELAAAQNELDNACVKLNQLVGLHPDDRPVLVDKLEFYPLQVANLNTEVNRVLESSPSVWLAEQEVTQKKYTTDLMFARGQYTPYDARQAEMEQAEVDAQSARDAVEMQVRELYHTLKSLEESYKSAEQAAATAQEELKQKQIMFRLGLATRADVLTAEVNLAKAKYALTELAAQHAYNKMVFQKPWAPAYSSTGG
ncbi:TolC family protein [Desulfofundulus thermosubterraneus]|uniref:Outer membrane protein TolC n=1 Tax=Desulfofundulus thermosubterraneus DSM 16057 TaxID=1121432 RepID=A0A1M6BZP4_9FIRM|nr:TolC family protein [Desulfofundulus thermosubterraneus]SHI54246.1 Outer membrane protein TolC [Desulfofundulus thermosubterraneus DSM 16057]